MAKSDKCLFFSVSIVLVINSSFKSEANSSSASVLVLYNIRLPKWSVSQYS